MQKMQFVLMGLVLLAAGCRYKFKYTIKLCNSKFYAEVYNINPAGVDEAYFTDSTTFRVYIGKFDNEHEMFKYVCDGDSITINKMAQDATGRMKIVGTRVLSVLNLSKNKVNSKEPLFEFK
jgi:hypothetical protein